jgi:polyhydroxyalkanoate synthesis regulator phasin
MTDMQVDETTTAAEPSERRTTGSVRRWLAGGAVAVALGALLLGGTAFAETGSGTASGLQSAFIDRLAQKLGITSDELRSAADEAEQEVIDEAVANGDLTAEQADALRERITQGDNVFGFGHGPGPGHHGRGPRGVGVDLDTIATTLGMTTDDLRAQLAGGTPLTEIITAQGSTVDAVVDALVAEAQADLEQKVADGVLTQEQADAILADLPARLTEMIENDMLGPWHYHRFFDNDTTTDDSDDSTTTGA